MYAEIHAYPGFSGGPAFNKEGQLIGMHLGTVRDVPAHGVQCDEIRSFCYGKAKNVARAKAAPPGAGDVWTWTGLEADSKLMISWEVGDRSAQTDMEFMEDLRERLANRVQLSTDGPTRPTHYRRRDEISN